MNITNEIRCKLVVAMLAHAVKKQAKPMHKSAKKLNDILRGLVLLEAQKMIPELTPARMTELIQNEMIKPFAGGIQAYDLNEKGEKESGRELGAVYLGFGKEEHEGWKRVEAAIDMHWGGYLGHVMLRLWDTQLRITTRSSIADLPTVPGASQVLSPARSTEKTKHFSKVAWTIHEQGIALNKLFLDVLLSAKAMHDDLWDILSNIRTLKQLEAQFPEALAFMPDYKPPVKNQVADPKLISRARQMLVEGIPD